MRTQSVAVMLAIALVLGVTPEALSADFVSMAFGLDARAEYPCPFRVETAQWAASDYPTYVVVHWRATRSGERREIRVAAPNGRSLVDALT